VVPRVSKAPKTRKSLREPVNGLTHLAGGLLACVGLIVLLARAAGEGRVDHMSIFLLIAGTYTPFCLLALDGGWRAGLLGLIWALALCRILLKFVPLDGHPTLALGGALPGDGLGSSGCGPSPLPGGAERGDGLGLGRCSGLQRGRAGLRAETP
jgi:hypothetical protein